jgi:hypothetical protein
METVGDLLDAADGVEPPKPETVGPFVPETLPDAPKLPAPGIYFGMPEEDYFALPALSASGIKDLLASPMLFWARSTWLSEVARKQKAREASNPKAQMARLIGRAYHCRLLEGAEEYAKRFACELTPEDCEGALTTTEQIKAAIEGLGAKPVTKTGDVLPDGQAYQRSAKKDDWIFQLLGLDPTARILDVLERQHEANHAGKSFIPADVWDQIEIAAAMVENDPGNKHAFVGGYPETVLIWYCAETGVPMKARLDRLKLKMITDLKSIDVQGRSMDSACARAIANYRYNYQPSVYSEGVQAVRKLIRESGGSNAFRLMWHCDEAGINTARPAAAEWVDRWAAETEEPKFLFLFQNKGLAPITRGMFYPMAGTTRMVTDDYIRTAKRRFKEYSEGMGVSPWLDIRPVFDLNDDDIPSYCTDL